MKRNYLKEITTQAAARPSVIWLYGPPGIGKTSFAAASPGCVFFTDPMELGIHTLKANGLVRDDVATLPAAENWTQVLDTLKQLAEEDHDISCLAFDTIEGFFRLLADHVLRTDYGGDEKAFDDFKRGLHTSCPPRWLEFLQLIDTIRDRKKMRIILLGHSRTEDINDPVSGSYTKWLPVLYKSVRPLTERWTDMILFARNEIASIDKDKRARAGARTIFTEECAGFLAKNRHGLPATIPMGASGEAAWNNLVNAIGKASK